MNFLGLIKPNRCYQANLKIRYIFAIPNYSFTTYTSLPIPNTAIYNQTLNELLKTIGWASKSKHRNDYFWDCCASAILAYKDTLKGKEIVSVLDSFSHAHKLDEHILTQLSRSLVNQLDQCRPSDLIIVLRAYTNIGISDLSCATKITHQLCENIQQLSPKGISLMACYLSKLGIIESSAGDLIYRESLKQLTTYKDTELLILLEAFQYVSDLPKYIILYEMVFYELTKRLDQVDTKIALKTFNIISQVLLHQKEILLKWRSYFKDHIFEFTEDEISEIIKTMSLVDLKLIGTMDNEAAQTYRKDLCFDYGFLTSSLTQFPLETSRLLKVYLDLSHLKIYDKILEGTLYHQFYCSIKDLPLKECITMIKHLESVQDTESYKLISPILQTIFERINELPTSSLIHCFNSLIQFKHREGLKYFIFLFLNSLEDIHTLLEYYKYSISSSNKISELLSEENAMTKPFKVFKNPIKLRLSASLMLLLNYLIKERFLGSDDFIRFIFKHEKSDGLFFKDDSHSRLIEQNVINNSQMKTFCEFLYNFDEICKPHHLLEALSVFPEHPASQKWLEKLSGVVSELPPSFFPLFIRYLFEKRKDHLDKLDEIQLRGLEHQVEQELLSISQFEEYIESNLLKLLFSKRYESEPQSHFSDKYTSSTITTTKDLQNNPIVLTQISTSGLSCLLKSISMNQKASPMIITIVSFTTQLIINRTMEYIETNPSSELEYRTSKSLALCLITLLKYNMEPPEILCKLISHSLSTLSNRDFVSILKKLSSVKSWHDEDDLAEIIRQIRIRVNTFENWKQALSMEESLLNLGLKLENIV